MPMAVLHPTKIPTSASVQRPDQFQGYGKEKATIKMTYNLPPPVLRNRREQTPVLRAFSGLRGSNAFDTLGVKSGDDFHSKVASAFSVRREKASRCVPKAMFDRFGDKGIKVIMLSQEEARRLGHNFVSTEMILLGLIGEGTGIAAKVLKSMGIKLRDARIEVEKIIGWGSGFVAMEIPFTPGAKRVLELTLEEARKLGDIFIFGYNNFRASN